MKLTTDFLVAKRACASGLIWFKEHFGEEADYQAVLNRLAQDNLTIWAD